MATLIDAIHGLAGAPQSSLGESYYRRQATPDKVAKVAVQAEVAQVPKARETQVIYELGKESLGGFDERNPQALPIPAEI